MFETIRILFSKHREYRRNASMSADEFAAMKLVKFRKLVRYAAEHSPYYQELIAERNIQLDTCQPADFPILTKKLLMANFDRIVTDPRISRQKIAAFLSHSKAPTDTFLNKYKVIHTSGSSGEMGYFIYSPQDWARGIAQAMRPRLPGTPKLQRSTQGKRGRMRLAFFGAIGGHFAAVTMMSFMQQGIGRLFIKLGLFEVNTPLVETISNLNKFQPDILSGYTGALLLLARRQQQGSLQIAPRHINTAGEAMSASDRTTLEAAFGCRASNGYGSSEHLMMGMEMPDSSNMLLFDDELIYEPCAEHTLVSNLFNFTLPLIRYRMADIIKPVLNRTFPQLPYLEINGVIGRTEIMPVFTNDQGESDSIHPITIAEIFVAGVLRFQLRWLSRNGFDFLVCLDPALDVAGKDSALNTMKNRLQELLEQKKLGFVSFRVLPVDELAVNPKTRKFQLVVDDRA